ncbi:GNAT family N-acetyltransferase [Clostridiaceae bacterium M8S5]|nr:GNAT family N-acetyltransferase [Clostridiaceae bacterium M8S5]
MHDLTIRRPKIEEARIINDFFEVVIRDTFKKNNIDNLVDLIDIEIIDKQNQLDQDFSSNGNDKFFLIVTSNDGIVGSICYGNPNDLIIECTNGKLQDIPEIGTVYVHPDYQSKGIGSMMIDAILKEMKSKDINKFCMDSGYKTAQKVWCKKFKYPEYYLIDYWDEGSDHMIWNLNVDDYIK